MKRLFPLFFFFCLFLYLSYLVLFSNNELKQTSQAKTDFKLQSYLGDVSLSDYKGKLVFIYFGYTWCPDICPTNLAILAAAFNQLNQNELKQVQGIFISVDPERDTTARLKEYTEYFHPNIIGISGTKNKIKETTKKFKVLYRIVKQDSATDYVVDHSSYTYMLDQNGYLIERLQHATAAETIVEKIRNRLELRVKS